MKSQAPAHRHRSALFGVLSAIALAGCFIMAPVGSFAIWIFAGMSLYCLFLAIWLRVPPPPVRARLNKKKTDTKKVEMDAYVRFHLRILGIMFLASIFIVLVILMLVG